MNTDPDLHLHMNSTLLPADLRGEKSIAVFPTQTPDRLASLVDFFRFFPHFVACSQNNSLLNSWSTDVYDSIIQTMANVLLRVGISFTQWRDCLACQQTKTSICTTWLSFPSILVVDCSLYIYTKEAMPVSSIRIILDRFYQIFCSFEKLSIWISPLGFVAVWTWLQICPLKQIGPF